MHSHRKDKEGKVRAPAEQPLKRPAGSPEVEDERSWAGQHGQRPANEEEKNVPPDPAKVDSQNE